MERFHQEFKQVTWMVALASDSSFSNFSTVFDKCSDFASFLRSIGIDILIDLNGYVGKGRIEIFNSRVCKLQISWLGYNNTIGLNYSDYLIADKNLIFEKEKDLYKEKIIYLDEIWSSHSGLNIERKYNHLPSENSGCITLGSFNNYTKISNDTVEVWSKILKKINNSKLILKSSVSHADIHFKELFEKEGVLKDRVQTGYKTTSTKTHQTAIAKNRDITQTVKSP